MFPKAGLAQNRSETASERCFSRSSIEVPLLKTPLALVQLIDTSLKLVGDGVGGFADREVM
jgi:hypothetical protein